MRGVRPWRSVGFRQLRSAAEGMLYVLGGGIVTALLVWRCGLPAAWVLRCAARAFWGIGALAAGRRAGFHGRRHGALEGMGCGLVLHLIWIGGVLLTGEQPDSPPGHLLLVCLAGAAGGIWGVNKKLRRSPD